MRGVVAIREYSDKYYLQDWERQFLYTSAREILSRAFLTKNEGVDSFNLRFEKSDTILGATVLQERLPTLEYFRRTSQIGGSPVYLSAQASISNLFINRGDDLLHGGWGRLDLFPVLSFPWKGLSWLSATTTLGGRFTGYTDSTDPAQTTFLGSTFTRTYMVAGVSLIGPSFSKIYEADIGPFGKFKHIIEPRIDYSYVSNVDEPGKIPVYDDIDTALGRNQITYALVNRLLAKSTDPKAGAASEIASFTLSQSYAFERAQTILGSPSTGTLPFIHEGPVQALFRFTPGSLISFDGQLSYDTRNGQLLSNTVATALNWKSNYFNATWFSSHPVPITGVTNLNTEQLRFARGVRHLQALPHRHAGQLGHHAGAGAGGPVAADVPRVLLHGLPGVPAASRARKQPQRRAPGREPEGHRHAARRQRRDAARACSSPALSTARRAPVRTRWR